jgi:uracil DNA glycosylase
LRNSAQSTNRSATTFSDQKLPYALKNYLKELNDSVMKNCGVSRVDTGTYISKQGQVLLAAVLASIAKNAGQAIADAQKTTSVLGAYKAATASNITGSKVAFVGESAIVYGGAMVV